MKRAFYKVSTPLSMVFDNDDIVDLQGVRNGISFMSANKDYSTYQNSVCTLDISVDNDANIVNNLYTHRSINKEKEYFRAYQSIDKFNSFNYAIFRTKINRFFFNVLDTFKTEDYQLFQKSWCYISAILGKCERLQNESYYYFIPGESIIQTGSSRVHKFGEWLMTLIDGDYVYEKSFPQMISLAGVLLESFEDSSIEIRRRFSDKFINEVERKNAKNVPVPFHIDRKSILEKSYSFDSIIEECIVQEFGSKENILNFEDFEYVNNEDASKESFVQWLNTL